MKHPTATIFLLAFVGLISYAGYNSSNLKTKEQIIQERNEMFAARRQKIDARNKELTSAANIEIRNIINQMVVLDQTGGFWNITKEKQKAKVAAKIVNLAWDVRLKRQKREKLMPRIKTEQNKRQLNLWEHKIQVLDLASSMIDTHPRLQ